VALQTAGRPALAEALLLLLLLLLLQEAAPALCWLAQWRCSSARSCCPGMRLLQLQQQQQQQRSAPCSWQRCLRSLRQAALCLSLGCWLLQLQQPLREQRSVRSRCHCLPVQLRLQQQRD
jgi:hypothetical protein